MLIRKRKEYTQRTELLNDKYLKPYSTFTLMNSQGIYYQEITIHIKSWNMLIILLYQ
ncbi:unnamed protein product [Paramecium sonneborni]|uniref:Uncharacterized protein n=1 Tax=Paramecium sonneborni TaxID=65129 RepID=A0A8S1RUV5_9CILI|nr:unnamed protein product [Paramecium sonneborni]